MRNRLSYEVVIMLVIKLALLYGIWAICFSHPIDKNLIPVDISNHILGSHDQS